MQQWEQNVFIPKLLEVFKWSAPLTELRNYVNNLVKDQPAHSSMLTDSKKKGDWSISAVETVLEGGKRKTENFDYLLTVAKVYSRYGGLSEATEN